MSRTSAMPASSLLREILRENPHLKDQRSKENWIVLLESVLSGHHVFGRIDREGLVRFFSLSLFPSFVLVIFVLIEFSVYRIFRTPMITRLRLSGSMCLKTILIRVEPSYCGR